MLIPGTSNFLCGHQLLPWLISKSQVANFFPVKRQILAVYSVNLLATFIWVTGVYHVAI
jgi:hypothetical protein